jgi:hypothetical protein
MRSLKGGQHTWTTECVDRDGAQEEWGISNCLRRMNITATNTADALGRERFIPFQLHSHLRLLRKDGPGGWYWAVRSYAPTLPKLHGQTVTSDGQLPGSTSRGSRTESGSHGRDGFQS